MSAVQEKEVGMLGESEGGGEGGQVGRAFLRRRHGS